MLIVNSVLVEPVVDGGLEIDVISKVSGSRRSDKELCFIRN